MASSTGSCPGLAEQVCSLTRTWPEETLVRRRAHQPAAPQLGMSHVDLLGAWLLPGCCSSVSPCTPWLSTYRHRLLSLHLILLLVPDAASYFSENESWTPPLCVCHCALRIRIVAVEKAAARLMQSAKSHQTSLLPCFPNLSIWLGHPFPTSSHHCSCSCLLHWLPLLSQGKCILLSPFPPLVCTLMSAVPDSEDNIWLQQRPYESRVFCNSIIKHIMCFDHIGN